MKRTVTRSWLTLLLGSVAATIGPASATADWSAWRGPHQDGTVESGTDLFASHFVLELAWRRPLGSAYSAIAIAGDAVVTLFAEGEADWLAALDAATGAERWRLRMEDRYVGHDGSEDGPSASPVIAGGTVYALGALGRLVAVDLERGSVIWERRLDEAFGALPSAFGFAATPLVVDDLLVVATGGESGPFSAFERSSGELRWRAGEGGVEYQSPVLATIGGVRIVLAPGNDLLFGLAPESGRELFRLDYGQNVRYATAAVVPVPGDRLLLNPWQDSVLYGVTQDDGSWSFDEVWRETTLDARLATSAWHAGHLYGFDGRFLTCVDGASGKMVWKSRPPGGNGLIVVDGHLVILGQGGDVVVVRATPDGYEERGRINALEAAGVTYPSFAGGRIFVRNTEEIAAVAVRSVERPAAKTGSPGGPALGLLAALEGQLTRSDTPHLVVDDFMRVQSAFPVIEDGGLVHFVWRGEADDVGLESSHLEWGEEPLRRLAGTDLWYRSERLDPGVRVEYRFNVDFDRVGPDPANPRRVPAEWGADYSVLAAPPVAEPDWQRAWRGEAAGSVERLVHESAILENEREIVVWRPPGQAPDGSARLLLVLEGSSWIEKGLLLDVLRHRVGREVAPTVVAFVGAPADGAPAELAGERTADFATMLADELVPMLTKRYGLSDRPAARALLGRWAGAHAALVAGLSHPDTFGHVGAISVLERDRLAELRRRIADSAPAGVRFHVAWNRWERWKGGEITRELADALRSAGHEVEGRERPDSAGWGGWRAWAGELLEALFPAASAR